MVDVAFVCLGNICRSPMAEAIMRQRLIDRNISGVNVYSKGTGKWNLGEPPHEGTQDILNRHNIPFDGMISELFESSDDFDYIIELRENENQEIEYDQMKQQTVKSKNSLDFGEDMFGGGFGFFE